MDKKGIRLTVLPAVLRAVGQGMALEAIAGIVGYQFLFYVCAALLTGGCVIFEVFTRKKAWDNKNLRVCFG